MRAIIFLLVVCSARFTVAQIPGEWTWMSGDSTVNSTGVFGTQGVPDANNKPPGLYQSCSWTDADGNFWLFGGANYTTSGGFRPYNTLWKYLIATNEWIWVKGANDAFSAGIYGQQGTSDINNTPGARYMASSWVDSIGDLWMFGGYGFDDGSNGVGIMNDLWKYKIATNSWTWMKGSNAAFPVAQYGQKGIADTSNTPNGRAQSNSWTDYDGNLWLFGGFLHYSLDYYNDLWRYNPTANEWTWMKGDSIPGQLGSFGTLGIPNSTNNPSARACQAHWVDGDGDLWMFGGTINFKVDNIQLVGEADDLWQFDIITNNWTWWGGANPPGPGNNGILCLVDSSNFPRSREQTSMQWHNEQDNLFLFGGNSTQAQNDLWEYSILNNKWVRKYGGIVFTSGIFGEKGISSGLNVVRSRYGGVSWQDTIGNFWLFGGIYDYDFNSQTDCFNDLWRYVPDTACGVFTSTNEIENENNGFEIYPNPANDLLNILSPLKESSHLILRNSIGRIILRKNISDNDIVDVSSLPTGMYYISISNGEELLTHKLILTR